MHAKVQAASADFTMSELFPLNAAVKADSVAFEYNATPAAACTDCPSGTYSSSSGSVSAGTCVACPTHSSSPPGVCGTLSHHHIACHIIISRTLLCLCVCVCARARECQHACRCDLRTGKHTYANAQTHMDMHAHMQLITHTRSWAYMSSTLQRPFFVCFADTS